MSSEFTKEEDYQEVRKNSETYWQFESTRDCTQLSMMDSQQLCGSRMRPNSDFTGITPDVCPVPSADTTSLLVFPTSVDVSPLGPVTLPSLKSPPCTIERAVLPDIAFPPPAEGDIEEDIWEQILPEDDCSLSGSDSLQALEGLTQAVLAGNAIQQMMLRSNIRCWLPSTRQMTSWRRWRMPSEDRGYFLQLLQLGTVIIGHIVTVEPSPTPDLIKLRSVVRRRSESPP